MKVNTKVTFVWDKARGEYVEESAEFFEWKGEVALTKGGGDQQTTTTEPWKGQQPYLTDLFQQAQQYLQARPPSLTGTQDLTQQAIAGYGDAAGAVGGFLDPIRAETQRIGSGALLDPSANPAFQQYLDLSNQAIMKQFTEGAMPAITGGAVAAGGIGSSRQGVAEALSAGKTMDAIARSSAGLTSQAYGQGLQATLQAQSLAPGFAKTYGLAPQFQTQAAQLQYGLETQEDEQARQRLLDYQRLVGGSYGGTTTGPATQSGGIAGALGGAGLGAGLYSALGGAGTVGAGGAITGASAIGAPWLIGAGAVAGYFS